MLAFLKTIHPSEAICRSLEKELAAKGIMDPIDMGFLDASDVAAVRLGLNGFQRGVFETAITVSTAAKAGWAAVSCKKAMTPPVRWSPAPLKSVPVSNMLRAAAPKGFSGATSTSKALAARIHKFVNAVPQRQQSAAAPLLCLLEQKDIDAMSEVLEQCWDFLRTDCADSPRWLDLQKEKITPEVQEVQSSTFRLGSDCAKTVRSKLVTATEYILFQRQMQVSPWTATDWQIARFAKQKAKNTKTGGAYAVKALGWLHHCCGMRDVTKSAIVRQQMFHKTSVIMEPQKEGKCPSMEVVIGLEALVTSAPTSQLRLMAGLLCCAVHNSCRGSDIQRTRMMMRTSNTVTGESRFKGVRRWKQWAFPVASFGDKPWVDHWLNELESSGDKGLDYLLQGTNSVCDSWAGRPAEHKDLNNALKVLLMLPPIGFDSVQASEYTPHGLKHFEIMCGTQLDFPSTVMDNLGHSCSGSKMPAKYNSEKCVREAKYRFRIIAAVKKGWMPQMEGELAMPEPEAEKVAQPPNIKRQRFSTKDMVGPLLSLLH